MDKKTIKYAAIAAAALAAYFLIFKKGTGGTLGSGSTAGQGPTSFSGNTLPYYMPNTAQATNAINDSHAVNPTPAAAATMTGSTLPYEVPAPKVPWVNAAVPGATVGGQVFSATPTPSEFQPVWQDVRNPATAGGLFGF